jgi:signal transduction histidine kinase
MVLVAFEDITPPPGSEERHGQTEHLSLTIRMARTLTHELNQPLSVLVGNLDLLLSQPETRTFLGDRIDLILKSADQVAESVRRLQAILCVSKDHDKLGGSKSDPTAAPLLI